jgi:pimeloyl-ACP methyl ester carboxylesterase
VEIARKEFPPYLLRETRAGAGTPVALLHGLSASSRWWSKNIEVLAARHLVAAVDLPPRLTQGEMTALLARWLETFGEPVHIMGHSMGGQLAIRLAAERPDLVRSLLLVSAAGIPFRLDPRPHVRPLPKPPYGGPRIAQLLVPDFFRTGPASVALATTRVLRGDQRERMRALRLPTLLVWGENDPLVPLVYGEAMAGEIEGARLVVIPRAAHVAMWDTPEEFNRIALEFLDEVERAPARGIAEPVFSWGLSGVANHIAYRQSGRRRDVVLLHGLGLSSAYFEPLARALFARGRHPIAPDLADFVAGPEEHARMLAAWADALSIRDATWIGHSVGCNTVAHLARVRPDLVRESVFIGPLWTRSAHPNARVFSRLFVDAFREPLALYRVVIPAYWRTGIARWIRTWRRYALDLASTPPSDGLAIAGTRDPIPDRAYVRVIAVPGAHACVFSHPEEVTEAAERRRPAG